MSDLDLIFLHVPKTGGISFRSVVTSHFGEERVFLDYAESPANPISPYNLDPIGYCRRAQIEVAKIRRSKRAVYGHFPIIKYNECRAFRATFLRDPIDRALSHYYFWKNIPESNHPVRNYMLETNLSLREFLQLPHIRGFYSEIFFPGREIYRFDFAGDFSLFHSEAERFGRALGIGFGEIAKENTNPDPQYEEYRALFFDDKAAVAAAKDLLKSELAFFEAHAGK